MTKVVDFGRTTREREAHDSGDCRKWTVLDSLHDLIETIEELPDDERPTMLILRAAAEVTTEDGRTALAYWDRFAGVRQRDTVYLAESLKADAMNPHLDD